MPPRDATHDRHWATETFEDRILFGLRRGRLVHDSESQFQRIKIVDTEFGKTLLLDDAFMCSERDEARYHEMLVHVALTTTPRIAKVLIIGGGDGGTAREVLRYPEVEQVTLCEIDGQVVRACQEHFKEMRVPWDDKRLEVLTCDGMAFVQNDRNPQYDVILVDGADPVPPADVLFSPEFYAACKKRLWQFGTLASQTESPFLMTETFVGIVKTMRQAFGRALPYHVPIPIYPSGDWSMTIATDRERWDQTLRPMEKRLAQIEDGCKYYNRDIHRAAFALPNHIKLALEG